MIKFLTFLLFLLYGGAACVWFAQAIKAPTDFQIFMDCILGLTFTYLALKSAS